MIEVGRYNKIPKSERFCPFCPISVEDEIHFLINCKSYNELRKQLLNSALKVKPYFSYYSERDKFCFLLSCENLVDEVAKFVWDAMELRKNLMTDTQDL